jgi:hypothetical protein
VNTKLSFIDAIDAEVEEKSKKGSELELFPVPIYTLLVSLCNSRKNLFHAARYRSARKK